MKTKRSSDYFKQMFSAHVLYFTECSGCSLKSLAWLSVKNVNLEELLFVSCPEKQITDTAPQVSEELFIKLLHPLSNRMTHQNRLIRGGKNALGCFQVSS